MSAKFGITDDQYQSWIQDFDTLSPADCELIERHIARLSYKPLISIIMPVFDTPAYLLREAITSVREQLYPHWELCIADDASTSPHVQDVCQAEAAADPRIKLIRRENNGHISAASNSALSIATGDFVALMDHDDLIPRHALYHVAVVINEKPDVDIIYSDEDQIDAGGRRRSPYFKTGWNPDLMLGHNVMSHLTVYRRSLLEKAGYFREGYEGSQDYDLSLRAIAATTSDKVHHIPHVLYHWRRGYGSASFSEAWLERCCDSARRAIADYLVQKGERGTVSAHPLIKNWHLVRRDLPPVPPLVSLLIPTRDKADLLEKCVTGLLRHTDYKNFEILILDNESREAATRQLFKELSKDDRVRIVPYDQPFNYSAINNFGATKARGSILGLLNNDVDVIDPNWLSEMVSLALLPEAGAIGARLLYADGRVQHGGVVLGVGGVANHFNHLLPREEFGYFGRSIMRSTVSAVTGACLVVRKPIFEEVNGLDEINLPVAFNDVDLCLRIQEKGYRNIWTPVELYHLESASRGVDTTSAQFISEASYMVSRWSNVLAEDPFYSPNMSSENGRFFLASPPRVTKPWNNL
ncbi:MAG: glycosyltransferase [Bradyrhizobium sp.]|uniref:glycosyltransferase family 2 protein n=1 Tax=Bradyrhizobium sp. TaxID=376 RepID=UPI0011F56DDD|nr:glycosyltransferase [Bradyrhizobium sp.]THD73086.1 MAG: glycosyltransferase [Bradyrhizobium sp.]